MTFKTAAKSTGRGLLTGLTIIANAQTQTRIDQIDTEAAELQRQMDELNEERDQLEQRLISR